MFDSLKRYELTVNPMGRSPADEYLHNNAVWIEGREGSAYTINIRNNTYSKALFIVSVDGLDILKGEPAGLDSQGYVVNPYQSISIPGWKVDNQQAAEFFFSLKNDSYSKASNSNTANLGVIGAMVFSEADYYQPLNRRIIPLTNNVNIKDDWPYNNNFGKVYKPRANNGFLQKGSLNSSTSNAINISASSYNNAIEQEVGTGFGNPTNWQTTSVDFIRSNPNIPDAVLAIYYNSARNLNKMGIVLRRKNNYSYQPDPFPAYTTKDGCKPPAGWKG